MFKAVNFPLSTALVAFHTLLFWIVIIIQFKTFFMFFCDLILMDYLQAVSLLSHFCHVCYFMMMKMSFLYLIILLGLKSVWSNINKTMPAFSCKRFLCFIFKVLYESICLFKKCCLTFFVFSLSRLSIYI